MSIEHPIPNAQCSPHYLSTYLAEEILFLAPQYHSTQAGQTKKNVTMYFPIYCRWGAAEMVVFQVY